MGAYKDFDRLLCRYLDSLHASRLASVPYEVIIVEEVDGRNDRRLNLPAEYLLSREARVIHLEATYPNPYNYNMIEAFAKNAGLRETKYDMVCITNCDIFFERSFFQFVPSMKPRVFYRCLVFDERGCLNPQLTLPMTADTMLTQISYKSGDIMILDKATWMLIGGFPESTVWVHSDAIVCCVVLNNQIPVDVVPTKVHTSSHARDSVESPNFIDVIRPYFNCKNTNPASTLIPPTL
jgi:hypothetical protein